MLAFASNSLLCRIALRDTSIDAASFTSIRLASGALVLWILLRSRGRQPLAAGSWPMAAMLFAYAVCFSFAYRDLTAATGALLLFGAVQLTMTGYGLFSGERLGGLRLVGVLVAHRGPPLAPAARPLGTTGSCGGPHAGVRSRVGHLLAARPWRRRSHGGDRRQLHPRRALRRRPQPGRGDAGPARPDGPDLRRGLGRRDLGPGLCPVVRRAAGAIAPRRPPRYSFACRPLPRWGARCYSPSRSPRGCWSRRRRSWAASRSPSPSKNVKEGPEGNMFEVADRLKNVKVSASAAMTRKVRELRAAGREDRGPVLGRTRLPDAGARHRGGAQGGAGRRHQVSAAGRREAAEGSDPARSSSATTSSTMRSTRSWSPTAASRSCTTR